MDLNQYDYDLPPELIAQYPTENRVDSRLLTFDSDSGRCVEHTFSQLEQLFMPGDLLVANDTRVIPARLHATKPTGGRVEIMLERLLGAQCALVQLKSNRAVRIGQALGVGDVEARVIRREARFYVIEFEQNINAGQVFRQFGNVPLPPYIQRDPAGDDQERYQTVYSRVPGAVAAPTAGLHFDHNMIDRLRAKGVQWQTITLHVGAGTFLPIQGDTIESHMMHEERICVDEETCQRIREVKVSGGRVIAIGTTVVRALESAARGGTLKPFDGETRLFITPGFQFNVVDLLVTNFHLPRSTLLILVSAFAGYDRVMHMYRYAIEHQFRFFSYGDAMLLERAR
ncbi:MAG: tRNA preQ1(34) S-adenosylmethionine ribosyltransferase-isomerase QueA [Arenicellales bacterium]